MKRDKTPRDMRLRKPDDLIDRGFGWLFGLLLIAVVLVGGLVAFTIWTMPR